MKTYRVGFILRLKTSNLSTYVQVNASDKHTAALLARKRLKETHPDLYDQYMVESVVQIHPIPISCMDDFELDRVYLVIKDSNDGSLAKGEHVWRDSNNPDSLNVLEEQGCLDADCIDDESVFSAEFEIDRNYVCITILNEDSRVMSRSFYESNVIIK